MKVGESEDVGGAILESPKISFEQMRNSLAKKKKKKNSVEKIRDLRAEGVDHLLGEGLTCALQRGSVAVGRHLAGGRRSHGHEVQGHVRGMSWTGTVMSPCCGTLTDPIHGCQG